MLDPEGIADCDTTHINMILALEVIASQEIELLLDFVSAYLNETLRKTLMRIQIPID